jgi:sec-independent protein translocase protein TatC
MNPAAWFGILVFGCLIGGSILATPFYNFFLTILPQGVEYIAFNPSDGFMIIIACGLLIGAIFFMVIAGAWAWFYFRDALYQKEKDLILKSIVPSGVLFLFGAVFGTFLYTQLMLPFFMETNVSMGLSNNWNLYNVIISGLGMIFMLGAAFQLPIVIRAVCKMGLIKADLLRSKRSIVIVGLLIISAVITPTPDILSQVLVAGPLYLLFETSLIGL